MGEKMPECIPAFGDAARLNHRRQIEQVKQGGAGQAGRYAVVVILKTPPDGSRRAAFLISRRFDLLAVRRNRARRLFRESFRQLVGRIDPCWVLMIPRRAIKQAGQPEVQAEIEQAFRRAGVLRDGSAGR